MIILVNTPSEEIYSKKWGHSARVSEIKELIH